MMLTRWLSKITMSEEEDWRRTDSKCADKDTKYIGIARLLDDRVPPHEEFIRLRRLKRSLACHGVVSINLQAVKEMID